MKGFVRELFTSIQGEGIRVGQRQTFIRFYGCNLSCNYCDTPETQKTTGFFYFQDKTFKNPVDDDFLLNKITEDSIAITGGEPLLQSDFLSILCRKIKALKKETYLDTNATLPTELQKVMNYIDIVSLDFKIPSATGMSALWDKHEKCLKIASAKEVFVKMIIDKNALLEEVDKTCIIIKSINVNIPLVIQPVFGLYIPNILDFQKRALIRLKDVRIIPQVHKYLGLR